MLKRKIKTHSIGNTYTQQHFFILSKGNNAGKPLREYCANCFVFLAEDESEKEFYFFVFLGLWELGFFKRAIIGSVIQFIRIGDVVDVAEEAINNINTGNRSWDSIKGTITQLEQQKTALLRQVDYILKIRRAILYSFIK